MLLTLVPWCMRGFCLPRDLPVSPVDHARQVMDPPQNRYTREIYDALTTIRQEFVPVTMNKCCAVISPEIIISERATQRCRPGGLFDGLDFHFDDLLTHSF